MKREAIQHTKLKRLCRRLDLAQYQAVGLLELLWHTTAREAAQGDIGRLSDEDLALALDWRGDEGELIAALVATGWLDEDGEHRLVVHDWPDHADDAVHAKLARARLRFAGGRVPSLRKLGGRERKAAESFYGVAPPEAPPGPGGGRNGPDGGQRPPETRNGGQRRPDAPGGSLPEPEPCQSQSPARAKSQSPARHPSSAGASSGAREASSAAGGVPGPDGPGSDRTDDGPPPPTPTDDDDGGSGADAPPHPTDDDDGPAADAPEPDVTEKDEGAKVMPIGAENEPEGLEIWISQVNLRFERLRRLTGQWQADHPDVDVAASLESSRKWAHRNQAQIVAYAERQKSVDPLGGLAQARLEQLQRKAEAAAQKRASATATLSRGSQADVLVEMRGNAAERGAQEWPVILEGMQARVDPESFATWFGCLSCLGADDERVVLVAPSLFVRNWVLNTYREKLIEEAGGRAVEVVVTDEDDFEFGLPGKKGRKWATR